MPVLVILYLGLELAHVLLLLGGRGGGLFGDVSRFILLLGDGLSTDSITLASDHHHSLAIR